MTDQTRELNPINHRRDIVLFLLILFGGWYGFLRWTHHVPAEPNAIIRAMAPAPKDGPYYDEEDVIRAIHRFGNVNWRSPGEHPTSFLICAIGTRKPAVVAWLIENGAALNPPGGPNPLVACLATEDYKTARILLHKGASWTADSGYGTTVREWAEQFASDALRRLPDEVTARVIAPKGQ